MNHILLISLILFFYFDGKSQCALEIVEVLPDCGSICGGSVEFKFTGQKPISYTFCNGYGALNSSSPAPQFYVDFPVRVGNLCEGLCNFQMTDSLGCTIDTSFIILPGNVFEAGLVVGQPNSEPNSCDGEILGSAIYGGTAPFSVLKVENCDNWPFIGGGFPPSDLCPGNYFGIVKDIDGCVDTTGCISTVFLSDNERKVEKLIVTVQANTLLINQAYENVKIYNLSGQIVFESNSSESSIQIDNLADGPYFVSVGVNGQIYNQKIVMSGE